MRLMSYDYSVLYVPGNNLKIAEALSHRAISHTVNKPQELGIEIEAIVHFIVKNLPVRDKYLEKIITSQTDD